MSSTSFSNILRIKLNFAAAELLQTGENLETKPNPTLWYKDYIFTIHSIIRSSVPLMKAAYDVCNTLYNENFIWELKKYFNKHIKEESNHDNWLTTIFETIGVSREDILSRKPSLLVAELVGSQYYWIYHWHPISLLGYIAILEGFPPSKDYIERLQKITKYPETAFRTIIKHSYLNPDHSDDLNNLLDVLPLEKKYKDLDNLECLLYCKQV